jgi:hypothetical protein
MFCHKASPPQEFFLEAILAEFLVIDLINFIGKYFISTIITVAYLYVSVWAGCSFAR